MHRERSSEERRIYFLSTNFKPFLLDLFCIVRHNLAFRILDGSLCSLCVSCTVDEPPGFSKALLRDLRMLSLQILFLVAKSALCGSENYIHVSTDGHELGTSAPTCCACPPQGHQTDIEVNTRAFAHIPFEPVRSPKECEECAHILLQLSCIQFK